MKIRQFDWRDLPILLRYRNRGVYFDTATVLTRGEMLMPAWALFSSFAPTTGIFTYLRFDNDNETEPLMGQVTHSQGEQLAHLTYLAPNVSFDIDAIHSLLEYMVLEIGERGAFHLMAEADEKTEVFEILREAGFALYVRQRIWCLNGDSKPKSSSSNWHEIFPKDSIAVRSLYNELVPALVQQVESLPTDQMNGLVYYQDGELMAYAELRYGQRGIWVQPFIHPDTEDVTEQIEDLFHNLPNRHGRPVYLCVRSYQSWLEHALEGTQAECGPTQAVMVKHLAIAKKVRNSFKLPSIEGRQQEITTPFINSENNN